MPDENRVVPSQMRDRSESELQTLLNGKREELHKMRFKHAIGQLRETHELRSLRRDIARIETLLGELRREAAGVSG